MRRTLKFYTATLALYAGVLVGTVAPCASMAQDVTQAEKLLFLDNHFATTADGNIQYTYHDELAEPAPFTGAVTLDVMKHHADGTVSVTTHFLSGEHQIHIPPLEQAAGNPAILGYLERDIAEMKRVTGGSVYYFRKQIRMALADPHLAVQDIKVSYKGKPIPAQKIEIQPYLNDPLQDRIGKFVKKRYTFVLSKEVPGTVYQLQTQLPDTQPAAIIESSLKLAN